MEVLLICRTASSCNSYIFDTLKNEKLKRSVGDGYDLWFFFFISKVFVIGLSVKGCAIFAFLRNSVHIVAMVCMHKSKDINTCSASYPEWFSGLYGGFSHLVEVYRITRVSKVRLFYFSVE